MTFCIIRCTCLAADIDSIIVGIPDGILLHKDIIMLSVHCLDNGETIWNYYSILNIINQMIYS